MNRANLTVCLALLSFCNIGFSQEWAGFRGPGSRGISSQKGLPEIWSPDKNIAWKVKIPGQGWSSPIVWGDRIFITTAVTKADLEDPKKGLYFGGNRPKPHNSVYQWEVHCYGLADGKLKWKKLAHQDKPKTPIHVKNTYASETPVTDGQHVYAFFGSTGLHCYDMEGNAVWSKNLGVFKMRYGWGTASSPILLGDKLFIQCDSQGQSFVAAFNKKDGKELWRINRTGKSSWATPYIWKHKARTELITCATEGVRSYDPETGKQLWTLGPMSSIVITTPFSNDDMLYINSGYVGDQTRPIYAILPGASGDLSIKKGESTNKFVAWSSSKIGSYNPSPILVENRLYVLYDRGILGCFDAATGQEIYKERLVGGAGQFTSSPWSYNGKIFVANEDGDTWVIPAGDTFTVSHINKLHEMFMATPAIAKGSLIMRGRHNLYCIKDAAN
jgi:outer membrane protein assembly factor BamB